MISVVVEPAHAESVRKELRHLGSRPPIEGVPTDEGDVRLGFSDVYHPRPFIEKAERLPGVRSITQM